MKNNIAEYLFHQGTNYHSYDYLGCNREKDDDDSLVFRTWAPNADKVELVCDIYGWDNPIPLCKITDGGVWELKINFLDHFINTKYKFKITKNNNYYYKGDPYAFYSVGMADGASIIYDRNKYSWGDLDWLIRRRNEVNPENESYLSIPINIYELHIGSFMRHQDGSYLSYRELAEILPSYLKKLSFTHVEFLPLQEYPFEGSWGYQVCSFFAISSRFGTPDDFKFLVDKLHRSGIGVILDFVGAHFPKDEWGLFEYDGVPLYEYQGLDRQESKMWGTRFFDVGREEVQSFLVSSAMYFLKELHLDGLRFDAVASMLYLDYDRNDREWIPNEMGTNENSEAVAFFKKLNTAIFSELPDVLMIAEESGSYGRITGRVDAGALGFSMKWNMGWANDFYDYVSTNPYMRKHVHTALNFPITYAFTENYCLPISHDEVVHGKKSFADKMFGSVYEKLEEARVSLLYFMTFPGKKLAFMGYEFAQIREWDYSNELEWFMLDFEHHKNFRDYVCALNYFYLTRPELWEYDFIESGFSWISCDENEKNIICYKRIGKSSRTITVALNFSGAEQEFEIPSEKLESMKIIFHTGNISQQKEKIKLTDGIFKLKLPPRSGAVLEDATYILKYEEEKLQ